MAKKLNLYPFDEFLNDFQELGKLRHQSLPKSFEESFVQAIQYFELKCRTKKELQFRVEKFLLICEYLAKNINDFDVGDFAVVGSEEVGSLVNVKRFDHLFMKMG